MQKEYLLIFLCLMPLLIPTAMAQEYAFGNDSQTINITIKPNNTIIVEPQDTTKLEELIQTLNETLSKPESQWNQGDLITASATIIAFFAFGILLTNRFTTKRRRELVDLLNGILVSTFGIQLVYLTFILIILLNLYHVGYGIIVIGFTVIFLLFIVKNTREIFNLEYLASEKNIELEKIRQRFKESLEQLQKTINENWSKKQSKLDEPKQNKQ